MNEEAGSVYTLLISMSGDMISEEKDNAVLVATSQFQDLKHTNP